MFAGTVPACDVNVTTVSKASNATQSYTINLSPDCATYQLIALAGANIFSGIDVRLTLPSGAQAGKRIVVRVILDKSYTGSASGVGNGVQVVPPNVADPLVVQSICAIFPGGVAEFIALPAGKWWIAGTAPYGTSVSNNEEHDYSLNAASLAGGCGMNYGVAVGNNASGADHGIAVGYRANGNGSGVAIGCTASGANSGVAVGFSAIADIYGVAVGYNASTQSQDAAVALGKNSKAERYREFVKAADANSPSKQSFSILDWYGDTSNATATELLLGAAGKRATVLATSAFIFKLLAVARDNTGNAVKAWEITGAIKRDGANNTALVGSVTKTVIAADAGASTWDIAVTADDTNETLAVTATGAAATTIRWNVRGDISELRF